MRLREPKVKVVFPLVPYVLWIVASPPANVSAPRVWAPPVAGLAKLTVLVPPVVSDAEDKVLVAAVNFNVPASSSTLPL